GAAIGGPIQKDRLFFFGNYDQQVRDFPIFASPRDPTFLTTQVTAGSAPAADCAATAAFFPGLATLTPPAGNNKVGLAKVDAVLSRSTTLSFSYNAHRWNSPNGVQTQPVVAVAQSMNGTDKVKTDFFVGSANSVLNDRMLNEFRFQAGRDYEEQLPNGVPPGTTFSSSAGIGFGMPNFLPRAAYPHEQRYQFLDSLTYYRGG